MARRGCSAGPPSLREHIPRGGAVSIEGYGGTPAEVAEAAAGPGPALRPQRRRTMVVSLVTRATRVHTMRYTQSTKAQDQRRVDVADDIPQASIAGLQTQRDCRQAG
eukprot:gene1056-biopygen11179